MWLWQNMLAHDPRLVGHRLVGFARDFQHLVNLHAPGRAVVVELRDHAAPPTSGPFALMAFREWQCLNKILGEESRVLTWFDALPKERRAELELVVRAGIIPLLTAVGRWADAGALWNPTAALDQYPLEMLEDAAARNDYGWYDQLRATVIQLLRALTAAGRDADAIAAERRARELDTSDHMANALDELWRTVRR